MKIYKYMIPIIYFVFWANELINLSIGSYSGYHALILHFSIYLLFELVMQSSTFNYLHIIRQSRFSYKIKQITYQFIHSILFVLLFYGIHIFILYFRHRDTSIYQIYTLYIPVMICFYFIFNIIQNIIESLIRQTLISYSITLIMSLCIYYFSHLTPYLEIFEMIYTHQFNIMRYIHTLFIFLLFAIIISYLSLFIFIKKDFIYDQNK